MRMKTSSGKWRPLCLGLSVLRCNFPDVIIRSSNRRIISTEHRLHHYSDVMLGAMASQITRLTIVYWAVCSGADQRKSTKLRVTGLCEESSPVTCEFTAQRASNAQNVPFNNVIMFYQQGYFIYLFTLSSHSLVFNAAAAPKYTIDGQLSPQLAANQWWFRVIVCCIPRVWNNPKNQITGQWRLKYGYNLDIVLVPPLIHLAKNPKL